MSRGPDPEIEAIEILRVFVESADPAFVAKEVADKLDVTRQGAAHQMEKLVDMGFLQRKKPGSRTVIYWMTEDGYDYYSENMQR